MKRLFLTLAGLALASACSRDVEERRAPADDNLTRPLEVARVDTTQPIAPVEHQVPVATPEKAKPAGRKAKPSVRKPRVEATRPAAAAAPAEDTASVQGYAPSEAPAVTDSAPSPVADSVPASKPVADTTTSPPPEDTVVASPMETNAPIAPVTDTVAAAVADTVAAQAPADTVASRAPDPATTSAAETAVADRGAARDTASVFPTPSAASTAAARTLPIGTEIHAALDDSINSRTDTIGRVITAVVMENVMGADGKTLIAAGAPVHFTVTRLSPARSKSAQGRLRLKAEGVGIGSGIQKISADVQPVPHELRGRGVTAGDAAKVGVGAAGGAVLGKVIGKSTKGAVIGGVIGAAGGAVVASQTATRDVVVKAKTPVVLVLTQPLVAQ